MLESASPISQLSTLWCSVLWHSAFRVPIPRFFLFLRRATCVHDTWSAGRSLPPPMHELRFRSRKRYGVLTNCSLVAQTQRPGAIKDSDILRHYPVAGITVRPLLSSRCDQIENSISHLCSSCPQLLRIILLRLAQRPPPPSRCRIHMFLDKLANSFKISLLKTRIVMHPIWP